MSGRRESYIRRNHVDCRTVIKRLMIRRELDEAVDRAAQIYRDTLLREMSAGRTALQQGGRDE